MDVVFKFNSTVENAIRKRKLSDTDILRFLSGYYNDQEVLMQNYDMYHADAHLDNILVKYTNKSVLYCWADFGESRSKRTYNALKMQFLQSTKSLKADILEYVDIKSPLRTSLQKFFEDEFIQRKICNTSSEYFRCMNKRTFATVHEYVAPGHSGLGAFLRTSSPYVDNGLEILL